MSTIDRALIAVWLVAALLWVGVVLLMTAQAGATTTHPRRGRVYHAQIAAACSRPLYDHVF